MEQSSGGVIDIVGMAGAGSEPVPELPNEAAEKPSFLTPVATGSYLWSTNPGSGRVALVDAESLQVRVLSAGLRPTYIVAVPGEQEAAAVINAGSSDASLFHVGEEVTEQRVSLHQGANSWAVSASGRYLVAYSTAAEGALPVTEGLQEITVVDRSEDPPRATRLTVGYRPSQVVYDEEESDLLVVDEEAISVVHLDGSPEVDEWIQLGQATGRDVSITRDGAHAVVRYAGKSELDVVPIDHPEDTLSFTLPGEITDLDLTPDGRAVGVVRDQRLMFTFEIESLLAGESKILATYITGEIVGSVSISESGSRALLYTTALGSSRVTVVTLTETEQGQLPYRSLDASLETRGVVLSPSGNMALILGEEGATGAFSLVALEEERFPRVVGTSGSIEQVALTDTAAIVTSASAAGQEAHLVDTASLSVVSRDLASPPIAAGIMTDLGQAYVAQQHAEGRVTFFDFLSGEARSLTGYELAADVVTE
jgi:hypothetical protein